jgi:hypothetical protein
LGVYVNYEHWRVNGDMEAFDSSRELNVPRWLRELTGDHFFQRVVALRFLPPNNDEALVHLTALPDLQCLYLNGSGNEFTDVGLAHLPQPDRLVHFQAGTLVGDGFVKRLAGGTEMEVLSLDRTRVTDEGLGWLSGLTNLKRLGLSRTQVSDEGLKVLKAMTELEDLSLDDTGVTDASLALLRNARNLRFIGLNGTAVTDAGLVHLHGLPKLISVSLAGTKVTQAGITALKAATPSLAAVDQDRARRLKEAEDFRKRQGK